MPAQDKEAPLPARFCRVIVRQPTGALHLPLAQHQLVPQRLDMSTPRISDTRRARRTQAHTGLAPWSQGTGRTELGGKPRDIGAGAWKPQGVTSAPSSRTSRPSRQATSTCTAAQLLRRPAALLHFAASLVHSFFLPSLENGINFETEERLPP